MFETLKNAFKVKEIRIKILITLGILIAFRLCCYIPVPGLDSSEFANAIGGNDFLGLLNSISGGSLANGTLFALGISPYINASIIMQLLCVGIPKLERLSKQGEEGKKKISAYTRILMVVLAIAQAIGIIVNFGSSGAIKTVNFFDQKWFAYIYMIIIYTAGAALTMWLGERITDFGVGNGISLIIFIGLISTGGITIVETLSSITANDISPLWEVLVFLALSVVIFAAIVTVDLAERRISVTYAKQVKGRKMFGGQSSIIPIRISGGGVMPLIFAFAILSFPSMIGSLFAPDSGFTSWWSEWMSSGTWIYVIVLCLLILGFSFFYAKITFDPDDVSKNIQNNGGFIQGIRPGKPTADYLKKISGRITLFGAIYLSLVAFIPSMVFSIFLGQGSQLLTVFSTTGLLIIVSVALEIEKQLQSQLMMKNYKGFLK